MTSSKVCLMYSERSTLFRIRDASRSLVGLNQDDCSRSVPRRQGLCCAEAMLPSDSADRHAILTGHRPQCVRVVPRWHLSCVDRI